MALGRERSIFCVPLVLIANVMITDFALGIVVGVILLSILAVMPPVLLFVALFRIVVVREGSRHPPALPRSVRAS